METSNIIYLERIARHRARRAGKEHEEAETRRQQLALRALRLQHHPLDEFLEAAET